MRKQIWFRWFAASAQPDETQAEEILFNSRSSNDSFAVKRGEQTK